ncbi:MAG: MauE/DoxX family redox-associated membrane protein [Bacteroidota bacterium]
MIVLRYIMGVLMIAAGTYHFINPKIYNPFMPDWMPKKLSNYAAGIAEIVIGGMLFFPATIRWGGLLFCILMVIFLPLHVIDLLRDRPLVGSKLIAVIRLILQFAMIYYGWWLWQVK